MSITADDLDVEWLVSWIQEESDFCSVEQKESGWVIIPDGIEVSDQGDEILIGETRKAPEDPYYRFYGASKYVDLSKKETAKILRGDIDERISVHLGLDEPSEEYEKGFNYYLRDAIESLYESIL